PDWLTDPDLKDWLQKHPTEIQKAKCIYCRGDISFKRKTHLTDHCKTKKHLDNIEAAKRLGTFVTTNVEGPSFRDRVHAAELKTSLFVAEHNFGIRLVDDLVPCMKSMCIDPEAVQSIKLKEDKCSQSMKTRPSATLKFCVSVQYFSKIKSKVVQDLLQLIELDGKKGTALDIFKDFKAFF
ncbi:hypothetical protein TSAR_008429, partial [Trichomalopsis sarcophagae]